MLPPRTLLRQTPGVKYGDGMKATACLLLGLGAAACAGGASSETTVAVTPAAATTASAATGTASSGTPAAAGPGAPADERSMVVNVGETTIRYVAGSAEATAAIMKGVRHARAAAIACYDGGATKNRGLRGKVVVQVLLDPSGSVRSVRNAGSTLPDADVVDCVLRAFRVASFAELDGNCSGDVEVTEPMVFAPVP
jgi:hypothetical protein